jgi:pyruvate dehydrogenase E1 component beta subunit
MPIEILMPALSPTMEEGTLSKWVKNEGDTVKSGDVIAEIETDKATMEVEAVDEGVIGKILIAAGTEGVKVNTAIAVLLQDGESADSVAAPKAAAAEKPARSRRTCRCCCSGCRRRARSGSAEGRGRRRSGYPGRH